MTLEEFLGENYNGEYVLLNNREMPLDTPLRNNDVILTLEAPVVSQIQARVSPEPVLKTHSVEEEKLEVPQVSEPVTSEEPKSAVQTEQLVKEAAAVSGTGIKPNIRAFHAPLEILLNDEPLVLPPKEDGQPYYLMDLLTHSGIDFDHLDRPIRLAVNGAESGFQQIIRTDDSVEIRCIG